MDHARDRERRKLAAQVFQSVLKAVDPYTLVRQELDHVISVYRNGNYQRLLVIGFGKAAFTMVRAVSDFAGDILTSGIIITKYGHLQNETLASSISCFEAAHPVPDENGMAATKKVIDALREADEKTLVVCLISGGGSALLAAPLDRITLQEKQQLTQELLKAGADIQELNTVRKHISRVKGGRLAEMAYPAGVVSLILSDVIGDRLDVIASGPTSPDQTTYRDALDVLHRYNLREKIPASIMEILEQGVHLEIPETPKPGNAIFKKVENIIIGNNIKAIGIAAAEAEGAGYQTTILSTELQGEARELGKWLAGKTLEARRSVSGNQGKKICLVAGGETTVTVRGNGLGGRNMELALFFAIAIKGVQGVTLLSAGTDGTDGPTDAAGAIVDGTTVEKAEKTGIIADDYLNNNDSYTFFKAINELFITGPTGTNVMDIQIILME
jgi:glycerate 2-kinase